MFQGMWETNYLDGLLERDYVSHISIYWRYKGRQIIELNLKDDKKEKVEQGKKNKMFWTTELAA